MEIPVRYVLHVSVALRTLFNFRRQKYGQVISVYGIKQLVFKKLRRQEVRTDFYQFSAFVQWQVYLICTFIAYFFVHF